MINILPEDAVLDAKSLPQVKMPNQDRLHHAGPAPRREEQASAELRRA